MEEMEFRCGVTRRLFQCIFTQTKAHTDEQHTQINTLFTRTPHILLSI